MRDSRTASMIRAFRDPQPSGWSPNCPYCALLRSKQTLLAETVSIRISFDPVFTTIARWNGQGDRSQRWDAASAALTLLRFFLRVRNEVPTWKPAHQHGLTVTSNRRPFSDRSRGPASPDGRGRVNRRFMRQGLHCFITSRAPPDNTPVWGGGLLFTIIIFPSLHFTYLKPHV